MIELVADLVRIPSVVGNTKTNLKALNFARRYLNTSPAIYKSDDVTSYLWSNSEDPLKPNLLLLGHLDVVDVDMQLDLFESKLEGSLLTGRGAGDMKGHVAVLLRAYKQTLKENNKSSVSLLLTSDEEVGGFNGAKYVVESGLRPGVLFLPDGSVNFNIISSEKAPYQFSLESFGKGGHAAWAFTIENPLDNILNFYNETRKEFDRATKKKAWASSYEMTSIETDSQSLNTIPSFAGASFSWRWPLEQIDFKIGRNKILKTAKKYSCKITHEEGGGEGTIINKNASYIKDWRRIIEKTIDRKVRFSQQHGASDARHFFNSKTYGTKNIVVTSANAGGFHSSREWVDIDSLIKLEQALLKYIDQKA